MDKKIFLTGSKGIGKSTIIKKLLLMFEEEGLFLNRGGFFTTGKIHNGEKIFSLVPVDPEIKDENNIFYIVRLAEERRNGKVRTEVFEKLGVRTLDGYSNYDLIIMDELGHLEEEAYRFKERVFEVLKGSVPVIGVVKDSATPFVNEIKSLDHVTILRVDESNRDTLPRMLFLYLRGDRDELV